MRLVQGAQANRSSPKSNCKALLPGHVDAACSCQNDATASAPSPESAAQRRASDSRLSHQVTKSPCSSLRPQLFGGWSCAPARCETSLDRPGSNTNPRRPKRPGRATRARQARTHRSLQSAMLGACLFDAARRPSTSVDERTRSQSRAKREGPSPGATSDVRSSPSEDVGPNLGGVPSEAPSHPRLSRCLHRCFCPSLRAGAGRALSGWLRRMPACARIRRDIMATPLWQCELLPR